jgi:3-hydroxyisobutyrate dehydrogenase-like beta-hydroxyacid dehydrogenase
VAPVSSERPVSSECRAVGLVGLGLIGTALAGRLADAGFSVVGTDIDPAACAALEEIGGTIAASAEEVARRCGRILIAVFDTDQVEAVLLGPAGVASAAAEAGRRIALVASTCDPDRIAALADKASRRGIDLLETPLSGTSVQVANGEAVTFVGGGEATMARCADILQAIAKEAHHMGAAGAGGRTKLAVNLILGLNRAALAEGLVYAERMGLRPERFLEVARRSAAYSQIMDVKGAKMIAGDFSPHGKVAQSLKDFTLILESAAAAGQTLPLAETYRRLMQACVDHGEGELDNCAVIEAIRRAARRE